MAFFIPWQILLAQEYPLKAVKRWPHIWVPRAICIYLRKDKMDKSVLHQSLLALRKFGFYSSGILTSKLPKTFLRRLFKHIQAEIDVSDFDGDMAMRLDLSEHMQRRIFWMGYYNSDIACILDEFLSDNMTVLDIGANIGEVTLLAAKKVGQNGQVYAFEPMDNLTNKLSFHVQKNQLSQVYLQNCALGNKCDSKVPIYFGKKESESNDGLGSLYRTQGTESPAQYIKLTTMDVWVAEHPQITNIDLVKIDIEGAELSCLQGGLKTLSKFKPKIIIEIQNFSSGQAGYKATDIIDLLAELGYEFYRIESAGKLISINRSSLLEFQNVLCIHNQDTNKPR